MVAVAMILVTGIVGDGGDSGDSDDGGYSGNVATLADIGRVVTESRAMMVGVAMAVLDGGYRDRVSEVVIGMMILETRYRDNEVV